MRALMQIPKNPPPRLSRPEEWTIAINDIVNECLTKDYEQRPMLQEVIEHPLFQAIPKTPTYIQRGLQTLIQWIEKDSKISEARGGPKNEGTKGKDNPMKNTADLIKTENLANDSDFVQSKKIAEVLVKRYESNQPYTYTGDILLAVNPAADTTLEGIEQLERFE